MNLSNILLSSSQADQREQSRKLMTKLRNYNKIMYETVYLKEHDSESQTDLYNLSYLYFVLNQCMQKDWKEWQRKKAKELLDEGESISRDQKDR